MPKKKLRTYGTGSLEPGRRRGTWRSRYRGLSHTFEAADRKAAETLHMDWVRQIDARDGSVTGTSFRELFPLLLVDLSQKKCKDIAGVERKYYKHVEPFFGGMDAGLTEAKDIARYIVQRLRETYGKDKRRYDGPTVNRELAIVRRMLQLALEAGMIAKVPAIRRLPENQPREGIVEDETYQLFLDALPDHGKLIWAYGYYTGVRKGELLTFEWTWVNWAQWVVVLPGDITKNSKGRTVPIYHELRALTEWAYQARNPDCPYFFQYRGKRLTGSAWRGAFERTRSALQLPAHIIPHDLRRTAVTNMERAGVPRSEARQVSGHKTESIYVRYSIGSEKSAQRVGGRMEEYYQNLRGKKYFQPDLAKNLDTADPAANLDVTLDVPGKYKQ